MRVILIKGRSGYDALRVFIDELSAAFASLGHEAIIVDIADGRDIVARFERHLTAPVDLVFSFNIFGEYFDERGRSVADIVGAPHVVHYMDYPLSHLDRVEKTAPNTALLLIDPSHVDAILSVYGPDRFGYVGFMAHAAIGATVSPGEDPAQFAAERPVPILFLGTFYKPKPAEWDALAPRLRNLYEVASEMALGCEWMPALEALEAVMVASGLDPANPEFNDFRKTAYLVHERVRLHRRFLALNTAKQIGLPLHVCGGGYENDLHRYKNVTYGGEVDFVTGVALMARSRVVLNINANFGAGSHDRPLSALNAGAAAASDYSRFYDDQFKAGEEIALYRWRDLETGLAALGALAEDPQAAFAMARAGQPKVIAAHTWASRVETIVHAAQQVRDRSSS